MTLFYTWFTSSPKIEGRILTLMTADWHSPEFGSEPKTGIFVYLYLINKRKNPVHILDYELEYDVGNGVEKAMRVYGTRNIEQTSFNGKGFVVSIPNFKDKVIYSKNTPIDYGSPIHGFAIFAKNEPSGHFSEKLTKLNIICIDAFGNRHVIKYDVNQEPNMHLLRDIADIEIKPNSNGINK